MSNSDMATFNQAYKNIERPYANVDLSKLPSWDLVMSIMEQQALEARRQIMARYHDSQMMMPMTVNNMEYHHPAQYTAMRNVPESDNSSYCSEEMDSSPAISSDSDMSQSGESDIEIDVDSIEEENDDYFVPSIDDIPITVLQLETKLRERDLHKTS